MARKALIEKSKKHKYKNKSYSRCKVCGRLEPIENLTL